MHTHKRVVFNALDTTETFGSANTYHIATISGSFEQKLAFTKSAK